MTTWFPEGYPTQPRVFYPQGPPPLSAATSNPNPPVWRPQWPPRTGSGTQSGSSASQTPRGTQQIVHMDSRDKNSGYPQLDLVDGVDYFKIGDSVRIRRWTAATDSFSEWFTGQIVRPVLIDDQDGSQRRSYLVSYEHPRTRERREKQFSPHFPEITSLEADPVSATPSLRITVKSHLVFAPIPVSEVGGQAKNVVYSPAIVLTSPNEQGGVRLRILAGPAAKREISNFALKYAPAYTAEAAQILRMKGFRVEGDGSNRAF
ncbi:hypothetical protein C8R44DRAFT_868185 [Mycena epipterygia]|nr:hypothetical protein C8R44DRAFT_868185 [Mycena epipterygia]